MSPTLRFAVLATILACAGCAGPQPLLLDTSADADAFECALAEAIARGYAVETAEQGVFFKADRRYAYTSHDVLNMSVARGRLVVRAETEDEEDEGGRSALPTSAQVQADAHAIVEQCGGG